MAGNLLVAGHGFEAGMKILVVDLDGARAASLAARVRAQDETLGVTLVRADENLLDAVQRAAPDLVIVDMERPDRDGLDSVRLLHGQEGLPVVMFVDDDDPAFMEAAIAAGVSSYHVHGAALPEIKPILRAAMAFFRHTQGLNARIAEAEGRIAARNTIEAAKRLLRTRDGLSEPAAHRLLQRRAMDQQRKLAEIAEALLCEAGQDKAGRRDG
ncbi:MAG TPA: ANTAR domain-containing protein [Acetobacteraceae bacterium]|nr:ANTAR domain-containing protein [Acetobacteraceae bacterium]